ncbi:GNAT family N-acetyltransferase [Sediminibacillus massiliensis]|uniref:GNAT family N-acetyltransferase n=1 Tax=Sediminibacillus massiliensis TaxID=1926277 RepID=UPI00098858DA|nr:GNAT family N-acetyltransferase [Sediminibacillus massiliensis]
MSSFNNQAETNRLIIRPLQKSDYMNWLEQFKSRKPSQHNYDKGNIDMSECTEEWFDNLVEQHQSLAEDDTAYVFGVFDKEQGTHLGMIDFSTFERGEFQWGRIGYTIHNQHWRKGFAKEAVTAALQIAFKELDYHRIEAHINVDNIPSINLADSVGMEFECTRKGFIYEFGDWTDNLIYYLNAKD